MAGIGLEVDAGGATLGQAIIFQVRREYRRARTGVGIYALFVAALADALLALLRGPAPVEALAAGGLVALEEVARAERARIFLCGETGISCVLSAASGRDVLQSVWSGQPHVPALGRAALRGTTCQPATREGRRRGGAK